MKMTDVYAKPGRTVAYYPKLALALDNINAAILLCQFIYWWEKSASGDGWVYKTADEIEAETGLTYEQQKGARLKLKRQDLIEERYERAVSRMYYRVDIERLSWVWHVIETHSANEGIALRKALQDVLRKQSEERAKAKKEAEGVSNTTPLPTRKRRVTQQGKSTTGSKGLPR